MNDKTCERHRYVHSRSRDLIVAGTDALQQCVMYDSWLGDPRLYGRLDINESVCRLCVVEEIVLKLAEFIAFERQAKAREAAGELL